MEKFKNPDYVLDIIMTVGPRDALNVAATKIVHPKNIKRKYLMSADSLAEYDDMICMVVNRIEYKGFEILDEKQSSKSYAYYVDFLPKDENGNYWDACIRIRFRIADHDNHSMDYPNTRNNNSEAYKLVRKSFVLGDDEYPTPYSLVKGVEKILDNLQNGDYSDL